MCADPAPCAAAACWERPPAACCSCELLLHAEGAADSGRCSCCRGRSGSGGGRRRRSSRQASSPPAPPGAGRRRSGTFLMTGQRGKPGTWVGDGCGGSAGWRRCRPSPPSSPPCVLSTHPGSAWSRGSPSRWRASCEREEEGVRGRRGAAAQPSRHSTAQAQHRHSAAGPPPRPGPPEGVDVGERDQAGGVDGPRVAAGRQAGREKRGEEGWQWTVETSARQHARPGQGWARGSTALRTHPSRKSKEEGLSSTGSPPPHTLTARRCAPWPPR